MALRHITAKHLNWKNEINRIINRAIRAKLFLTLI